MPGLHTHSQPSISIFAIIYNGPKPWPSITFTWKIFTTATNSLKPFFFCFSVTLNKRFRLPYPNIPSGQMHSQQFLIRGLCLQPLAHFLLSKTSLYIVKYLSATVLLPANSYFYHKKYFWLSTSKWICDWCLQTEKRCNSSFNDTKSCR